MSVWLAAIAVLASATPDAVRVVVGANQSVSSIALSGGCRADGKPVDRVAIGRDGIDVCFERACRTQKRVDLECQRAVVRTKHGEARYGRSLTVSPHQGSLRVVATLELEAYVAGVVEAELGSVPIEAARAQAIVARTYALRAMFQPRHDDAHLCDLTHCQVFRPATTTASDSGGPVLLDAEGRLAEVFFHGACGGHTIDARDVWPDADVSIIGVDDRRPNGEPWCASGRTRWTYEIGASKLAGLLSREMQRTLDPQTLAFEPSSTGWMIVGDARTKRRVRSESLQRTIAKSEGWGSVESPNFTVVKRGQDFRIEGTGRGHLVGLCQSGAIARAKSGQVASEILAAYFPKLLIASEVPRKR